MISSLSKGFSPHLMISLALAALVSSAVAQAPVPAKPGTTAPAPAANTAPVNTAPVNNDTPQPAAAGDDSSADPSAQEPSANDQAGMFVFKKEVEEIILHATVFDAERHLVPDLDRGAFAVFQNGTPQTITAFRRQDVPVAMGIVIDNSGSMRDKRDEVNRAVLNLIRASNPEDEIFVVNFSKNYYLDQDFTSDVNLLQTALHQVSATGSTALYDAVVASAVHLKNNTRLDNKVLLVITDGQDNMSQETLEEALHRLQQKSGPTIYAVGLLGDGLQRQGRDALARLAQGTGGVAYFPENLGQVADITRTVAHDIRSQYTIAYRPQNQNGKPDNRSLRVEAIAPGHGKLTVSIRSGYHYAGDSSH
jgi:Ca-activated chloride channel family protein